MTISPTIRQLIVIGSCQLAQLSCGAAIGYPMVLLNQLRKEDSPIKLDVHTVSWIGSMHGIAGIFSVLTPTFMQRMGRRAAFILGCFCVMTGWIVAYNANSFAVILVCELIHGFGTNSLYAISLLSTSEMTTPTFRNVSVQSYGILQSLGLALTGIFSTFLDRQNICLIMSVPITIAFFMSILWPESPSWLACKGRFDDCYESFRQLRKIDSSSKLELEELIAAQKENLICDNKNENSLASLWTRIRRRDFYLPAMHVFILLSMIYWSGSGVVLIHSFDLIRKTTNNERAPFWGGTALNVAFFVGMFLSSIINKRFKTKTILITSAVCTTTSLFGVFLITLLQNTGYLSKDTLLSVYFLVAYMIFDSLGVIPMVFTIVSEIMPVKHRGLGGAGYVIFNCFLVSTALKISPYLFSYINVWGTFLFFTCNAFTCGLLTWRFVPETKGRTLQQIEDFYMFGKFVENRTQHGVNKPWIED